MNLELLIDSIVRQTTVLIAQLATTAGGRAPLAHLASEVFANLVRELKEQGLGNRVIADMFGLTLRTYHHRVQRLAESATFKGRSLWEAVLSFVEERGVVRRMDVLRRFSADDERMVRAVLADLVESGVFSHSGRGDAATYRLASADERTLLDEAQKREGLEHLLVVTISRFGPISREEIGARVRAAAPQLDAALATLTQDGRVTLAAGGGEPRYTCEECVIPFGEPAGWEAAVFDHYQAMVTALGIKLRQGQLRASIGDAVGGSTYTFDLWEGHPLEQEVLALLQKLRREARALRARVDEEAGARPASARPLRVIAYVGQAVLGPEEEEEAGVGRW